MPSNDYHFMTHWRVKGTINEVADVLKAAEELPRWWASVYLDVKVLEPGDKDGIGKIVRLLLTLSALLFSRLASLARSLIYIILLTTG